MAAPTDVTVRGEGRTGMSELNALRTQFNKLVTNLRVLTAKLDADGGVTDADYQTLITDTAASGPAKVNTIFG